MLRVIHVLPHRGGGAERYVTLLEQLEASTHVRFALSAGRTPASALLSLPTRYPRLMRAMRGADLVHAHGDAACLLTLPLLGRIPSVWTTHGLHLVRRRGALAGALGIAIGRTRVTICTSQAEADELSAVAPALRSRLVVIHNGVELPPPRDGALRASARAELGVAKDMVAALFLGELEQRKAPLEAVAAVRSARAAGAAVVLLVAGRGPLAGAVAARGGEAVHMLGFREDTHRLFAACDLFVSASTREGLSFALLEAMAHGLAVVASDGPGNPEAVGDAGVIVTAGDSAGLAHAVQELAQDRDRRKTLGAAARERVAREFALRDMLALTRAAYERALTAPVAGDGGARA